MNKKYTNLSIYLCVIIYITIPFFYLLFTIPSLDTLVKFSPDDAFYYLQIGYNVVNHKIISFDGINVTTGFHPLQLIITSILECFFNKNNTLVVLFLYNFLAIAFSFIIISSALKTNKNIYIFYSVLTLPIFNLVLITNSAMESATLLVILSLFYYSLINLNNNISSIKLIIIGVELGLICLTRLDMVIPMAIFGFYLFYILFKNRIYKNIYLILTPYLIIVSPYLIWMFYTQGSIFPISSIVKQNSDKGTFQDIVIAMTGGTNLGILLLITPIATSILAFILYYKNFNNVKIKVTFIASITNIIYLVYIFYFAHEAYRWSLNYCLFTSLITLIIIFDVYSIKLFKFSSPLRYGLPVICLLINIFTLNYWSNLNTVSYGLLQMTYKINNEIPINSNIGISDSGVVGYFSTSNVHNLDGLVNSKKNWIDFLQNGDILGYSLKYNLKYLLLKDRAINKFDKEQFNDKFIIIDRYKIPRFSDETLLMIKN